jgi:hypothetical protein
MYLLERAQTKESVHTDVTKALQACLNGQYEDATLILRKVEVLLAHNCSRGVPPHSPSLPTPFTAEWYRDLLVRNLLHYCEVAHQPNPSGADGIESIVQRTTVKTSSDGFQPVPWPNTESSSRKSVPSAAFATSTTNLRPTALPSTVEDDG